jgi:hypothetical protein
MLKPPINTIKKKQSKLNKSSHKSLPKQLSHRSAANLPSDRQLVADPNNREVTILREQLQEQLIITAQLERELKISRDIEIHRNTTIR